MTASTALRHTLNVDRGVALLDAKLGRDVWLPRVNLGTLRVESCNSCVLCQATDTRWYGDAVQAIDVNIGDIHAAEGVTPSWTERHGFGISLTTFECDGYRDFPGLQAAWVERIAQLRDERVNT